MYTRDEDVFIPLLDRTKIANDANGSYLLVFMLMQTKTERFKVLKHTYFAQERAKMLLKSLQEKTRLLNLRIYLTSMKTLLVKILIMATMAQSTFMKESEDLASIIQTELDKKLNTPNRGVKQAGFYVLIGASMPNALVEVGFLSNPSEEKMLKQSRHKQNIAEAIYHAIKSFKSSREKLLVKD